VAIVGAGFTGLWSAYYLKRKEPGLRIVVVEREISGFGPSGRNGGWVSAGIAGTPRAYGLRPGDDAIVRATHATHAAVDEIGYVTAVEKIECGYRQEGAMWIATSEPQRWRLQKRVESSTRCGGEERMLKPSELDRLVKIPGVVEAAYSPHAARVDPGRLVRGLAGACERLGVTIHERTAALEVAPGIVRCAEGTVRADTVLCATEAYTTSLPGQRRRYLPLYSLMVATEPLPADVWGEIGWRDGLLIGDLHHLFFYAQRTTDGRIAVGGRGAPYRMRQPLSVTNERSMEVYERLRQTIRRHFPAAADARLTHHWGCPLGVPRDWSMSVKFDSRTRLGSAGGYSGHGVVASNISGHTLADLTLGLQTDRVTLPWVQHTTRGWEPEPLRYIACRAIIRALHDADQVEDGTGKAARRVKLVAPLMPPN
jgi:glycine/D-amino acid oxidase-like deaminating enzyme